MSSNLIQKIIEDKSKDSWWLESERRVIGKFGKMFDPKNLDNLTKEDFKSFLLIKNNLRWEAIYRQGNIITTNMPALIKFLMFLLNERIPLKERLDSPFIEKGGQWVKGVGRAIMSAILLVVYPKKYGVWNSKSEAALKKLGLHPAFKLKDSFGERYIKFNQVLLDLAQKYNISLWQLDGVLGEIAGNSPFSTIVNEEEMVEEDAKSHGVDIVNFGMEKQLEDFLIANWDKTIFGKKYDLIYKEGDLLSQQYETTVGLIDILAISKNKDEYLIIELKKGRTSDAIVGQLLRYMAWVKENLAKDKKVSGVIVVLDFDEKLKYSLKELNNIKVYTYKVDFKLVLQDFD